MTQIATAQAAVRAAQRDLDDALAAQRLQLAREADLERRQRRDAVERVPVDYVPSRYSLDRDVVYARLVAERSSLSVTGEQSR